jgi:hypothetical protein
MQTFLPHESFEESAAALDLRRLGKQIIEARQIGRAITDPTYGWQNHPAVRMWRRHLSWLLDYADAMNDEWRRRRGKNHGAWENMWVDHQLVVTHTDPRPPWLGNEALHLSHRSNLLRKAPDVYRSLFEEGLPDDLPYVWPV